MKQNKLLHHIGATEKNRIAFQGGSYSLIMIAVVLALVIVVNIFVAALPTSLTQYDISATKLYSITSNTKAVVNALSKDVTIHWIVQSDMEDPVIENLLGKYEGLSDHIKVEKKNPDIHPAFAQQYTDEPVQNNSLVVECGERSRFIGYDDIYLQEADMTSYSVNTSFDGEGAITSAIDYVVNEVHPKVYQLEGHGEAELPSVFRDQLEKDNMELASISLLNSDAIPEDAACVMIYAPASDISPEEKDILSNYVEEGGKLMVMAGPVEEAELKNLYSLLEDYGVTTNEGIVVESDREHYLLRSPMVLMPNMEASPITDPLSAENYYTVMPLATGLTISEDNAGAVVTPLLMTSNTSFSKVSGYEMTTFEQEEGDVSGPFAVAVSVECGVDGQMVWFTSSAFLDNQYNAYSSGANVNMAMNAFSSMIGESESMAIRSKSLNYNYLTISDSTSSLLKVLMIGVFPLLYLGVGITMAIKRRRLQNESI